LRPDNLAERLIDGNGGYGHQGHDNDILGHALAFLGMMLTTQEKLPENEESVQFAHIRATGKFGIAEADRSASPSHPPAQPPA
jgi:hypothetical protein